MASSPSFNGSPQILVPPSPTRDCSQGFCTAYCPQWCYVFPPPPYDFSDGGGSSTTLSPLVIAIIGILAGALLLVTYYTIISKYCGTFESLWGFLLGPGGGSREAGTDQSIPAEELHGSSPSSGISKSLIDKMVICKYKRGDGLVNCTDCAVCLSEFREEENFRLLPECSHAFHVQCIDTWLKSHTNCPICRAGIVAELPPPPPPPPPPPSSSSSSSRGQRNRQEVVVDVDQPVLAAEEEAQVRNNGGRAKRRSGETANGRIEIRDEGVRRNNPEDSSRRGNSIATVLQTSMEVEMSAAKEQSRRRG